MKKIITITLFTFLLGSLQLSSHNGNVCNSQAEFNTVLLNNFLLARKSEKKQRDLADYIGLKQNEKFSKKFAIQKSAFLAPAACRLLLSANNIPRQDKIDGLAVICKSYAGDENYSWVYEWALKSKEFGIMQYWSNGKKPVEDFLSRSIINNEIGVVKRLLDSGANHSDWGSVVQNAMKSGKVSTSLMGLVYSHITHLFGEEHACRTIVLCAAQYNRDKHIKAFYKVPLGEKNAEKMSDVLYGQNQIELADYILRREMKLTKQSSNS